MVIKTGNCKGGLYCLGWEGGRSTRSRSRGNRMDIPEPLLRPPFEMMLRQQRYDRLLCSAEH